MDSAQKIDIFKTITGRHNALTVAKDILSDLQNKNNFKIGITGNVDLSIREKGEPYNSEYKLFEIFTCMDDNLVRSIEKYLIEYFRNDILYSSLISNISDGGEGPIGNEPPFYVYIAIKNN